MEHLMEIMTTGTETFCIVLLLNTFFERKYTSYRFFFPLSAAFLFYLWLPLNTILATSFVTKLFISILIWLVFSQIFYTGALPFHLFLLCSFSCRDFIFAQTSRWLSREDTTAVLILVDWRIHSLFEHCKKPCSV